jgi:hypothetical protein
VVPAELTILTAVQRLADETREGGDARPPGPPADLVEEGREIPLARVQAMHEGKRRARRS